MCVIGTGHLEIPILGGDPRPTLKLVVLRALPVAPSIRQRVLLIWHIRVALIRYQRSAAPGNNELPLACKWTTTTREIQFRRRYMAID